MCICLTLVPFSMFPTGCANIQLTALHMAAAEGNRPLAEQLIGKGADVNGRDEDDCTPLHRAALKGHKGVVEFLIAKGGDVNAKSKKGVTPCLPGSRRTVRRLIG